MLLQRKKNHPAAAAKGNRFLISVTVMGTAGAIRFVVNEDEVAAAVIDTVLKSYAREGRLPVLGSHDVGDFMLYCSCDTIRILSPWETIGSLGFRDFKLIKKPQPHKISEDLKQKQSSPDMARIRKISWLNKSLFHKVSCH